MPDSPDYEAILADLEAKKLRYENAIEAIKEIMVQGPGSTEPRAVRGPQGSPDANNIASDAFFRLTLSDAIKKQLNIVKRKQSVPQIAAALERGGFQHRSKRFAGTVQTTLRRGVPADFLKVGRGQWALAEWHKGGKIKKSLEDSGLAEGQ